MHPVGVPEFDASKDILYANINGIQLVEGEDYTVSGTGSTASLNFKNVIDVGNTIEIRVVKSVIG